MTQLNQAVHNENNSPAAQGRYLEGLRIVPLEGPTEEQRERMKQVAAKINEDGVKP
jgi:hypothetical protein